MAEPKLCARCKSERAAKIRTATARCDECTDPICSHHTRHEDGAVRCKNCHKDAKRAAARRIQSISGSGDPALAAIGPPGPVKKLTHQEAIDRITRRTGS